MLHKRVATIYKSQRIIKEIKSLISNIKNINYSVFKEPHIVKYMFEIDDARMIFSVTSTIKIPGNILIAEKAWRINDDDVQKRWNKLQYQIYVTIHNNSNIYMTPLILCEIIKKVQNKSDRYMYMRVISTYYIDVKRCGREQSCVSHICHL